VTDYLADTSAVWRLLRGQIGGPWPRLVAQGVVAICPPVESELMVGVRAGRDFEPFTAVLRRTLPGSRRLAILGGKCLRFSGI